jgi:hypothetical protein
MNKITQRSLRDLHSTLPAGTECYLSSAVRSALAQYRKGREPVSFLEREQALSVLTRRLGRGLKRFFVEEIRRSLPSQHSKMA